MGAIFLDVGNEAVAGTGFVPATLTTTTAGSPVDLILSNANMASAVLMVGAVSGTQGTIICKLQESATSTGTFTDIPNAVFTAVTTSGTTGAGNGIQIISYQRSKRYVQPYFTASGTFTNMLLAVGIFSSLAAAPQGQGGWTSEQGGS